MSRQRTLVIAPGHSLYDERVLRTVEAASTRGACWYALEREALTFGSDGQIVVPDEFSARLGREVRVLALPQWKKWPLLSRFTRQSFARRIARQAQALAPTVVHVHESGSLGLLIAHHVKRLLPDATVVFDYHDWIPWEIAETCRGHVTLYRWVLPLALTAYHRLARAVDVAVCISPGQAEWTQRELGIRRTLVVENVRPRPAAATYTHAQERCRLVFVGHVMRIRRIEFLIDVLAELSARGIDASLTIFGRVSDAGYGADLTEYAAARGVGGRVAFHGPYRSDAELAAELGRGSIGMLLAVPEPIDTGIHAIASPNKFFSYMTLGLPTMIEAEYEGVLRIARAHGAGDAFSSVTDCAAKVQAIVESPELWERMSQGAFAVAREMNSDVYMQRLDELYSCGGAQFAAAGRNDDA